MIYLDACFCSKCHSYNPAKEIAISGDGIDPSQKLVYNCYKCQAVNKVGWHKTLDDTWTEFNDYISSDGTEYYRCPTCKTLFLKQLDMINCKKTHQ